LRIRSMSASMLLINSCAFISNSRWRQSTSSTLIAEGVGHGTADTAPAPAGKSKSCSAALRACQPLRTVNVRRLAIGSLAAASAARLARLASAACLAA
jgi:hypothetical protein